MRYLILLAAMFAASVLTLAAKADDTTYYVCDTGGNDSNDGLSTGAPWLTFEKGMTQMIAFEAGDQVLFCKGGEFTSGSSNRIRGTGCTPANPCIVDGYGTGDDPLIHKGIDNSVLFYIDREDGLIFRNIQLHAWHLAGASASNAFYIYGTGVLPSSHITMDNLTVTNFARTVQSAVNDNSYIVLKNSSHKYANATLWLGSADNSQIVNNVIDYAGWGNPTFNHSIYFSHGSRWRITDNKITNSNSGTETPINVTAATQANPVVITSTGHGYTTNDTVVFQEVGGMYQLNEHFFEITVLDANTFSLPVDGTSYAAFTSGGTVGKYKFSCGGVPIVGHGIIDELYMARNEVREEPDTATGGCWGIAIDNGGYGDTDEQFTNITIEQNIIENVGNIAIGCSNCGYTDIQLNTILQDNSNAEFYGIKVNSKTSPEPYASNNVRVQFNQITIIDDAGVVTGIDTSDANSTIVKNNVVIFGDTAGTCTNTKTGQTTLTDNYCFNGSSLTPNTTHTDE